MLRLFKTFFLVIILFKFPVSWWDKDIRKNYGPIFFQPARKRTTQNFFPELIPRGMSDTSVTGPPGLSVCHHLWGASGAFARPQISRTVVRPENSCIKPTLHSCQRNFFVCKHFLFPSLFLRSPSLHPPRHLPSASTETQCEVSRVCQQGRGFAIVCELCMHDGSQRWVSVCLPFQPTQGPLTTPQVHRDDKPSVTHLVLHRWTLSLVFF